MVNVKPVFENNLLSKALVLILVSGYLFSGILDIIDTFRNLFPFCFWVFEGVIDYEKNEGRRERSSIFLLWW